MLRPWQLHITLNEGQGRSLQERLLNSLIGQIQSGRLPPGEALPGSRTMAQQLGVNRKTVQWVFDEMIAQGWLISEPRRATRVSPVLPEATTAEHNALPAQTKLRSIQLMPEGFNSQAFRQQLAVSPNDGVPDLRLIPYEQLASACRRGLLQSIHSGALGYGDPRGELTLRQALKQMLSMDRFMNVSTDEICVVRGSQMGIFLTAQLLDPGKGAVVLEALSYPPAQAAFEAQGFKVLRCRLDEQGLDTEHLQTILAEHSVAAVYITPHHQYPTTVCLSVARRMALLKLSLQYDFVVVEDDYDHEFHYDSRPVAPLASLPEGGNVIHIGSLSKVFAPGLRLGYMVAAADFIDRIAEQVMLVDRQGNAIIELAVADLMASGQVKRHIRKARRIYQQRRDFTVSLLNQLLPDKLSFDVPAGGMALWLKCHHPVSDEGAAQLRSRGFSVARSFGNGVGSDRLRFGFGSLSTDEINEAVVCLAQWLR
ncbi:PLP-dependent aminotransferase family protein [Bowmanella denitrificans]|uniref:MocR-like pyridoxine biosynthesis transcription factor PdxR n=1 Tax=Bowmanella denitrificans TaxID=366582 RepID=UPI000C9A579F|nr:PLP-dependent aminotransferase family protein [Bowmanella denitrificans]